MDGNDQRLIDDDFFRVKDRFTAGGAHKSALRHVPRKSDSLDNSDRAKVGTDFWENWRGNLKRPKSVWVNSSSRY